MPRRKTLRNKIEQRVARNKGEDVFLTREFRKLGGEDQVLRALRSLVEEGRLAVRDRFRLEAIAREAEFEL